MGGSAGSGGTSPLNMGGTTSAAGTTGPGTAGTAVMPNGGHSGSSASGGVGGASGGSTSSTAGTAATTGGSSACPQYAGTLAKDSTIFMGGFGTATTGTPKWSGYGFTFKYGTATITPGAGNGCFVAAKFCANGSIPASDDSGAGLGWNIAQASGAPTPSKVAITTPIVLKFAGITEGMRAQLSASATVSYCYPFTAAEATAGTATVPLASFKTACWGTTGTAYDGVTPIEAIQIVVPGSTAGAVKPFDICVTDIEPGM